MGRDAAEEATRRSAVWRVRPGGPECVADSIEEASMKPDKTTPRVMVLGTVMTAALISVAHAGPCSDEIAQMQARIDAGLNASATVGRSAPESTEARTHRQPTPGSVAAAEEKAGDISAKRVEAVTQAMARARAADSAGDKNACERALADAQRAMIQ